MSKDNPERLISETEQVVFAGNHKPGRKGEVDPHTLFPLACMTYSNRLI